MSENKIKDCPFCGGPAEMVSNVSGSGKCFTYIRCRLCRGQARAFITREKPDLGNWTIFPCYDAILSWNLRTGSEPDHSANDIKE